MLHGKGPVARTGPFRRSERRSTDRGGSHRMDAARRRDGNRYGVTVTVCFMFMARCGVQCTVYVPGGTFPNEMV